MKTALFSNLFRLTYRKINNFVCLQIKISKNLLEYHRFVPCLNISLKRYNESSPLFLLRIGYNRRFYVL